MSLTTEDILVISQLMDEKLKARLEPIEDSLNRIEALLENNAIPGLGRLESRYTDILQVYKDCAEKLQKATSDIELLKRASAEQRRRIPHIM